MTDSAQYRDTLNQAKFSTLDRSAATGDAKSFVSELTDLTLAHEAGFHPRKRARRQKDAESFTLAIGALAADLIKHSGNEASQGFMYRPADKDELAQTLVSTDNFTKLRNYWIKMELIEESGFTNFRASMNPDDPQQTYRKARRFRAKPRLLELAQRFQITSNNITEHFERSHKHARVIQVRATKDGSYLYPQRAKLLKPKGPRFEERRREVEALNVFLTQHQFSLSDKPMLRRIFSCGDRKGFDYNLGGRFYCASDDDWTQKPKSERRSILIDGEPTCEVDVSASQLAILYSLQGEVLNYDADPYQVSDLPREVVKGIVVAAIGRGELPKRWPRSFDNKFIAHHGYHPRDRYKLKQVVGNVVQKHPILNYLEPGKLDWAVLQYEEAECFLLTMQRLSERFGVPFLPVHDSLIVKQRHQDIAISVLEEVYNERLGFVPRVKSSSDIGNQVMAIGVP